jgi:hypothetical protein
MVLSPCCKAAVCLHLADGRLVPSCSLCFREVTLEPGLLKTK